MTRYRLLKDLPNVKAGRIYLQWGDMCLPAFAEGDAYPPAEFPLSQVRNTPEWFEKIESKTTFQPVTKMEEMEQQAKYDNSPTPVTFYDEADLISFGNFLLSEQRRGAGPENTLVFPDNLRNVTDADVANWKDSK